MSNKARLFEEISTAHTGKAREVLRYSSPICIQSCLRGESNSADGGVQRPEMPVEQITVDLKSEFE